MVILQRKISKIRNRNFQKTKKILLSGCLIWLEKDGL